MINNLPLYISLLFGLTVVLTIAWFYKATGSKTFLLLVSVWTIIQSIPGLTGFYLETDNLPPRIMLFGMFPTLLFMAVVFFTAKGRKFINNINIKTITSFHSIRIPVEVVLALLYYQGVVSVYMTFEGTNFDLFSGITAAPVAYLAFRSLKPNRKLLLGWNILCLLLLLNVVVTAAFALPTPFQLLAFDQPNVAILYFPFNLLPTVVVPLVLFAHLVVIYRVKKDL